VLARAGMAELQNIWTIGPNELRPAGDFSLGSSSREKLKEFTAEIDRVTADFQRALDWDTENRLARIGLAANWYLAGNMTRADSVMRSLLAEDSLDVEAWNNLGIVAAAQGDSALARRRFARAIRLRPYYAEAIFNHGLILQGLGLREEAISALQDYLKVDSQSAWSEAIRTRLLAMTMIPDSSAIEVMNEIRVDLEILQRETFKEKALAENVGSKRLASELFNSALVWQREGEIKLAAGEKVNLLAAQKAYAAARAGFKRAREQVESMASAMNDAETARKEMLKAKQQVPGREVDKLADSRYAQALQVETAGNSQFQVGDFGAAQSSFLRAKDGYLEAATAMIKSTSASVADAAKTSMLEARANINRDSSSEEKYQQATTIEAEANSAYSEANFDKAVERYQAAEAIYASLSQEDRGRLVKESESIETAQREIQSLIIGYKEMFENEDFQALKTLYKENEMVWSTFFQVADKIQVTIENNNPSINGNNAEVVLTVQIEYVQRGKKEKSPLFHRRWSLEEIGGKWAIVSMKVQ
jgi:tetratricopeptide (TPR) repeat protein